MNSRFCCRSYLRFTDTSSTLGLFKLAPSSLAHLSFTSLSRGFGVFRGGQCLRSLFLEDCLWFQGFGSHNYLNTKKNTAITLQHILNLHKLTFSTSQNTPKPSNTFWKIEGA